MTRTPELVFTSEQRLLSLDFFRGITMFLLIAEGTGIYNLLIEPALGSNLINTIGRQFHHHPWNGRCHSDRSRQRDHCPHLWPGTRCANPADPLFSSRGPCRGDRKSQSETGHGSAGPRHRADVADIRALEAGG